MLRNPPISAVRAWTVKPRIAAETGSAPQRIASGVVQVGGQLGLVVTLDGITLCVVPLGVLHERDFAPNMPERNWPVALV